MRWLRDGGRVKGIGQAGTADLGGREREEKRSEGAKRIFVQLPSAKAASQGKSRRAFRERSASLIGLDEDGVFGRVWTGRGQAGDWSQTPAPMAAYQQARDPPAIRSALGLPGELAASERERSFSATACQGAARPVFTDGEPRTRWSRPSLLLRRPPGPATPDAAAREL